jgi:hypothetical protein
VRDRDRHVQRRRRVGRERPGSADRWVTLNTGADRDPFNTWFNVAVPQVGFAFDGVGAARATAVLAAGAYGAAGYGWTNVTSHPARRWASCTSSCSNAAAPPRGRRSTGSRSCRPSAGQQAAEINAIQNFAIPADGTSALALPPFGGTITSRVFEADQATWCRPRHRCPLSQQRDFLRRTYNAS